MGGGRTYRVTVTTSKAQAGFPITCRTWAWGRAVCAVPLNRTSPGRSFGLGSLKSESQVICLRLRTVTRWAKAARRSYIQKTLGCRSSRTSAVFITAEPTSSFVTATWNTTRPGIGSFPRNRLGNGGTTITSRILKHGERVSLPEEGVLRNTKTKPSQFSWKPLMNAN